MGKYISVGVGSSTKKNGKDAGKEAAQIALKECGKTATFSLVYIDSSYKPEDVSAGIQTILGTSQWIGFSTDKQFNQRDGYFDAPCVSVLTISSEYMHFGIGVSPNYRKNPEVSARKATEEAMNKVKSNNYVDAYVQFNRAKMSNYNAIVRTPPYFILSFASGAKLLKGKAIPGQESEFLNGIISSTGPNIPIFGGSASSSFEDYIYKNKGDNFQIVNGKCYTDAGIVVFVVTNLLFTTGVEHGYEASDRYATITKLDKTGYTILSLNDKEPVAEYARLLGVTKEEYLKDPSKYSLTEPFGIVDINGNIFIREALPNEDKKTLHSTFKVNEKAVMKIMKYNKKKTVETVAHLLTSTIPKKSLKPAVALVCNCSGRRPLLQGMEGEVVEQATKKFKNLPLFGFYSFGEVGTTATSSALPHSQTVTSLVILDALLTQQ